MDEVKVLSTVEEIKAFSDMFRFKILNTFYSLGKPSTVKQIADSINETPAKVHYHVKKMEKVNILKLVYTEEINGIVAKYYEPTAKGFNIQHKDGISEVHEKLIKSETERVISEIYNNSRQTFINQIRKGTKDNLKSLSRVSSGDLYLTKEEMENFVEYIMDYFTSHELNLEATNKEKYHYFFSIVKNNFSEGDD
jgi:DNA-binding Lrp family transcriptional regulator